MDISGECDSFFVLGCFFFIKKNISADYLNIYLLNLVALVLKMTRHLDQDNNYRAVLHCKMNPKWIICVSAHNDEFLSNCVNIFLCVSLLQTTWTTSPLILKNTRTHKVSRLEQSKPLLFCHNIYTDKYLQLMKKHPADTHPAAVKYLSRVVETRHCRFMCVRSLTPSVPLCVYYSCLGDGVWSSRPGQWQSETWGELLLLMKYSQDY